MCAGYGLEMAGPNSRRSDRPGLSGPISPGDTESGRTLLEAWHAGHAGQARITGRAARNLNPLITEREGDRELSLAWWWLHVDGAPARFNAFNSRADRLLSAWRTPFQHRALVPATWYTEKGVRFGLPDAEEFAMAVVTSPVRGDTEHEALTSYSLVTRDALADAAVVHNRMPMVLPRELHDEWLDPHRVGDASLLARALNASAEIAHELRQGAGQQPSDGQKVAQQSQPDTQPRLF